MSGSADLVSGRYRLTELLGSGGSASVFAAVDERTGDEVALKLLHPHLTGRPAARAFFLAEAGRAGTLRHPRIVSVLDVGVDEDRDEPVVWIALERAPGVTLAEHVRLRGPLEPQDAVALMDAVLDALTAAHEIGLVHRDISPSNVMFDADAAGHVDLGSIRLLDFGIADATGEAAVGAAELLSVAEGDGVGVLGNARYLSPEQLRGEPVDERGDVYQVGAVLYFALVGQAPFARTSSVESARAHLEAPPPVPSVARPGVPRSLDRIVVRAMLKSPDDRFADAAAMRTALAAALVLPAAAPGMTTAVALAAPSTVDERVDEPVSAETSTGVTRVMGATLATRRDPVAVVNPFAGVHRHRRSGGIAVMSTVAAAVILGIGISLVTSPSASVTTDPTPTSTAAAPTPTSTPTESPATRVEVTVPAVEQLSVPEAIAALEAAGLVPGPVTESDGPWPQGRVLQTEPAAQSRVARGSVVSIVAASGFAVIPAVAGLLPAEALQAVSAAGFAPTASNTGAAAIVIGTSPAEGSRLPVGSAVALVERASTPTPTPSPTTTTAPTAPPPSPPATPTPQPTGTP